MSHFVYRVYDLDDRLLYVGQTADVDQRMRHHQWTAWWYDQAVVARIVEFDTQSAAEEAERVAIATERPAHNRCHRRPIRVRIPDLKASRSARGLTQAGLAQLVGCSAGFIGLVETGRKEPSLSTLERIAEALCVGVSDIADIDGEPPSGPYRRYYRPVLA